MTRLRPPCASRRQFALLAACIGVLAVRGCVQDRHIAALEARRPVAVTIQRLTVGNTLDVAAATRGLTQAQLPALEDDRRAR